MLKLLRVNLGKELMLASIVILLMSFAIIVGLLGAIRPTAKNPWCASYANKMIILWKVVMSGVKVIYVLHIVWGSIRLKYL
jgi:hypothetical protein